MSCTFMETVPTFEFHGDWVWTSRRGETDHLPSMDGKTEITKKMKNSERIGRDGSVCPRLACIIATTATGEQRPRRRRTEMSIVAFGTVAFPRRWRRSGKANAS